MLHWIKHFLIDIEQTAGTAVNSLREVLVLKSNTESLIRTQFGRRTASGIALLQSILNNPVITVERAVHETGLSYKAANDLVSLMVQHSILNEITGQSRNRIFVFDDYLNIFMKY
jgi:hypothetical protein